MLIDQKAVLFGSLLLFPFILYRIHRVKQVWQGFENLPARSLLVSPFKTFSRFLPRIPWISDARVFSRENVYERKPVPMYAFLYSSQSMSRRLRSFQLRYCSAPVTVSVQYRTSSTRRCYSYQGGTSLQVSAFVLNRSIHVVNLSEPRVIS